MHKDWTLDQPAFDALLAWLAPDRDQAGERYEEIRRRLIKIFTCRGCHEPEDLADETINRVVKRLPEIGPLYDDSDRALYFYGVANKVYLEFLRRRPVAPPAPTASDSSAASPTDEPAYVCLERCIEHLSARNRELVLRYYQEDKRRKIDERKRLAAQLGIALNALRIRAHRIRARLQQCVEECLAGAGSVMSE
jgi:DNA-directed RNA polymerase specialized sigma24 family protein